MAYKLCSARQPRLHKSSSTPEKDLDYDVMISGSRLRHMSGESDLSITPRFDQSVTRRVKSQENLSSSVGSDVDFVPLSSSKDTVILSQLSAQIQGERKGKEICEEETCKLLWQRSFAYPVMGLNRLDITGDGMEDLIIVTLKGLHILQVCYRNFFGETNVLFIAYFKILNSVVDCWCMKYTTLFHLFPVY